MWVYYQNEYVVFIYFQPYHLLYSKINIEKLLSLSVDHISISRVHKAQFW